MEVQRRPPPARPRPLESSIVLEPPGAAVTLTPSGGSKTSSTGSLKSPSGGPVAKKSCWCGTTVLFPPGVVSRTCWKCARHLHVDGAVSETPPPRTPPDRLVEPSSQLLRPPGLPRPRTDSESSSVSTAPPGTSSQNVQGQAAASSGGGGVLAIGALFFVVGLLIASLCINAALYKNWLGTGAPPAPSPTAPPTAPELPESDGIRPSASFAQQQGVDTDGDGIPDHHDWCPGKRKEGKQNRWISGRASDFDGDGCEDGVEDQDRDNDGIADNIDRCPFSPQQYNFVSDAVNDFDGDGCKDGVEDLDDDGDGVANDEDECHRTRPGESSDRGGCSRKQRERNQEEVKAEREKPQVPEAQESVISEWVDKIRSAWLEVLLGALITPILTTAKELLEWLRESLQPPKPPMPSAPGLRPEAGTQAAGARGAGVLRALLYILFFGAVYAWRLYHAENAVSF